MGSAPGRVQPGARICPDSGCAADFGQATNFPIGSPLGTGGFEAHTVSFWLSDLSTTGVPIDILDPNRVEFDPAGLFSADPTKEFKPGKLTFENGTWTGDADLGLWIDVFDSTSGAHYDFQGLWH